jgi:ATP/maltotriose-dependent transcriptional regulator MalT
MAANSGHESGTDAPPLLVEAKLAVPSVRHSLVDRPRVRRALDAGRGGSLTLVAAPAGYGKTTAVRDWCASVDAALAWVVLDAGENDPVALWRYVATAVERVRPGLGRGALRRLGVAGGPVDVAVDELMNGAAAQPGELVIVLDDLHAVTNRECLESIDYALAHLPSNTHVVLVTRVDPALRLARLRAARALAEVRQAELAFTPAEAHELLVVRGHLELAAEQIDVLVKRTEGWPAALVLAWLWLRTVNDPARAVLAFGGDHRFVADYLSSEVLATLDEDELAFLHGAAVLGAFTAALCDDVLDRTDSAARLSELERTNLLVSKPERGSWFRIHPLFAEYARAQLAALDPGAPLRIHRRAAERLRGRGLPVEAVDHAAAAGDHELVAQLLAEQQLPLIGGGASRTLLRWVRTLPDDRIAEHPELAVGAATATVLVGGNTIERRRLLQLADTARAERPERAAYVETAARLVRALTIDGGVTQAVIDGRRAVTLAQEGAEEILTGALAALARALFFAGELEEAWAVTVRTLEHPAIKRHVPSLVVARSTVALVAIERGWLVAARGHAEKAKAAVGRIGTSPTWLGANASAALGSVLAAEGSLAEAERRLATAERFFSDEVATLHDTWLLVLLARVRVRRGRLDAAAQTLRSAHQALDELVDSGRVPALADEVDQELEAVRGRSSTGNCSSRRARRSSPCCGSSPPTSLPVRSASASSCRRTRSARTGVRCTSSSGSTPGPTRSPAPPSSVCWSKPNHPGDRALIARERLANYAIVAGVGHRTYRLIVEGELSDDLVRAFPGMALTRAEGTTALTGDVRDQAELLGLLQRVSDLGLSLIEASAIDDRPAGRAGRSDRSRLEDRTQ